MSPVKYKMTRNEPSFSIIIPTLNEEASIGMCIESLKKQDFKGGYEIIVVDNGSTDNTVKIVTGFGVRVIVEPEKGQVKALITGCRSAKGAFYVFTDGDTILPPDWLFRIYNDFNSSPDIVAVGGLYVFHDTNPTINNIIKTITIPVYQKILFKKIQSIPSANMAVRASIYREIGGFDSEIGWGFDVELCKRLKKKGTIFFDSELIVSTSFRRYKGQNPNPFLEIAHSIKEIAVQAYRLNQVASSDKIFKQQKAIRLSTKK